MTQRLAFGVTIKKSRIHGKGCFATILFRKHQLIAEYVGERISIAEAERRRGAAGDQSICDVDAEWAIDGRRGGNGTQYVNHSCEPNAYVIVSKDRIFIHALKTIVPGEEITTNYLYELNSERTPCGCGADTCDETANLWRTDLEPKSNGITDCHPDDLTPRTACEC